MSTLLADHGYFFGIGAFETIAVENGKPMFLTEHYNRLKKAADFLELPFDEKQIDEKTMQALEQQEMKTGRRVLKITLSEKNLLVTTRENTYRRAQYEKGFDTDFTDVRRNETSPFTYHKTLNYGDCLFEKHKAKEKGIDEPVFLNMAGNIAEGATTNVFFVKNGGIYTPSVECGLLNGIIRDYLCREYSVEERKISPEEIAEFDEMFLTNSLLGIMPVNRLGSRCFPSKETGCRLLHELPYSL